MKTLKQVEEALRASIEHSKELEREIEALIKAQQRVAHHIPLPRSGVDYAFPPHPQIQGLKRAGITFVMRYLTGTGKELTRGEARALTDIGQDLAVIYETTGRRVLEGFAAGEHDGNIAAYRMKLLGAGAENAPVYFAEDDFDAAGEGKIADVIQYMRGVTHSNLGWHRAGLYGGYEVIETAHADNVCKYLYQTYAWSGGRWSQAAQIRQVLNGVNLLGGNVDLDKAHAANFGQFKV